MAEKVGAASRDPLWVPLLTHFQMSGKDVTIDRPRMAAHIRSIQPDVRQYLLGGSTGNGWDLNDDQFGDLVEFARASEVFQGTHILIGALRKTTAEVIARAQVAERVLAPDGALGGAYTGLTICPPVADASQAAILAHYRAILEATHSPIAVYQLPQVTGCSIEPATMRALAMDPRVMMFKDTSGTDTIAAAGPIAGVTMVRGAEGGYLEALHPNGPYDGWLLSSANVFGRTLRRILDLRKAGERVRAGAVSRVLAAAVEALFQAAEGIEFGNPFANANRAADHVLALGQAWSDAPAPISASGDRLPAPLLAAAADILGALPRVSEAGYLAAQQAKPHRKVVRIEPGDRRRARHGR